MRLLVLTFVVVCLVTADVAAAAGPALLTRPAVAGRPYTGETATVIPARWRTAAAAVERRWIRCVRNPVTGGCRPQDIAGATGVTYLIADADLNATVYVAERAQDATGSSDWVTSNAPGDDEMPQGVPPDVRLGPAPPLLVPRWTALPAITGTWRVGATLTASPGAWTPSADAYEYQWQRCIGGEEDSGEECEVRDIPDASRRTYVLGPADEGAWPQVRVRARTASGWSPWAQSLLERWDPVGARVAGGPPGGDGGSGSTGGGTAAGTVRLTGLMLKPTRFRAAARGASLGPGRGGTRVTARTSTRPASMRIRVEQRRGSRWIARGTWLRHRTPTSSTTTIRVRFSGRLAGRRLAPGAYRLRAVAVDAAGRLSAARTARFTVVR
jgi:hypothetical protein